MDTLRTNNDETYVTPEMRDKAYKICREFLSGSWKSISSNDMVFKSVSGGLSNLLYYCSLPETHTPLNGEPSQVMMRMYGQLHNEGDDSTITESVICTLLSERNIGPKLYGVFPGGRLEEYIPARALICEELRDHEISATIARKIAKLHTLNVPVVKEPIFISSMLEKFLHHARNISVETVSPSQRPFARDLLAVDFEGEIEWLLGYLKTVNSPVVFCHNDLQEGNILSPEGSGAKEDNLVFIDFEYCAYNYRGFELANHFCEWMYDYSNENPPYYFVKKEKYPTLEEQKNFIKNYLMTLQSCFNNNLDDTLDPSCNTVDHVLSEVRAFTLASHLVWCLWSIFNAQTSKIPFGYWEYGRERYQAYIRHKSSILRG